MLKHPRWLKLWVLGMGPCMGRRMGPYIPFAVSASPPASPLPWEHPLLHPPCRESIAPCIALAVGASPHASPLAVAFPPAPPLGTRSRRLQKPRHTQMFAKQVQDRASGLRPCVQARLRLLLRAHPVPASQPVAPGLRNELVPSCVVLVDEFHGMRRVVDLEVQLRLHARCFSLVLPWTHRGAPGKIPGNTHGECCTPVLRVADLEVQLRRFRRIVIICDVARSDGNRASRVPSGPGKTQ
jgi:hypothetical protein